MLNPIEVVHVVSAGEAAYNTLIHHFTREHPAGLTYNGTMPTVYERWPIVLRSLNVSIATSTGVKRKNVPIWLYYLPSPSGACHLRQALAGIMNQADWQGSMPMDWGFGYSVGYNALTAGDIVSIFGTYEARDPRLPGVVAGGGLVSDPVNWEDVPTTVLAQNGAAASGGAGIAFSRLTVGIGQLARVDLMWALHDDDGGARVIQWNISDGTTPMSLDGGQSLAGGVRYQLYGGLITGTVQGAVACPAPIVIGAGGYIEARVGASMVDGHLVNISGLYRLIKGVR